MKLNKKTLLPTIVLSVICLIVAALLAVINGITAPIIKENENAAIYASLREVMPDGKFDDPEPLPENAPVSVQQIYKEQSGKGYVVVLSTKKGYTGNPINLTVAIDNDGKLLAAKVTSNPETKDADKTSLYPSSLVGKGADEIDAAPIVTGATFTSKAMKNAIKDALVCLNFAEQSEPEEIGPKESEIIASAKTLIAGSTDFELVELEGLPETVKAVYKETTGKGYAVCVITKTQYNPYDSGTVVATDGDGKVIGIEILAWNVGHEVDYTEDFVNSFAGKTEADVDSVELVTGATGTSGNIRSAVKDALGAVELAASMVGPKESEIIASAKTLIAGSTDFELVELEGLPETVKAVYKETTGKGYAVCVITKTQYNPYDSGTVVAIDGDGKVIGIEILAWNVGHDVDYTEDFVNSFAGKTEADVDSVELVTGATGTSGNIRSAVKDALGAAELAASVGEPESPEGKPQPTALYRGLAIAALVLAASGFVTAVVFTKKKKGASVNEK